jgi:UDP-glucuronate decarboxylase
MKILVTGGAGLIGSYLCEKLLENNHRVLCVDNFKTGSLENLETCMTFQKFSLLDFDIVDWAYSGLVDQIYNLASPTAPGHFKEYPIGTIKANVTGTINVLEFAKHQNIPVVHVSTMRVLENTNTFDSNACYVEGKRVAETICYEYKKNYNMNIKVCRLFNIYGERMRLDDSRVLPQFIIKALKNEPLKVLNNGLQKDSFCYVNDIIVGLIKLMDVELEYPITLGSREMVSIRDLAELIINVTNSKSEIKFIKDYPDKIFDRSNIIINNLRDWEPETKLETGIKYMYDYFGEEIK